MATLAGTNGTMNHVFAAHFTNSRDVPVWIRIINMHLISLALYAVYFHVFLKKYLPYPGSPDETTRLGCVCICDRFVDVEFLWLFYTHLVSVFRNATRVGRD